MLTNFAIQLKICIDFNCVKLCSSNAWLLVVQLCGGSLMERT